MKMLVMWLRKNGNCQCWSNANRTEQLEMGIVTLRNSIERKAREEQISLEEAWNNTLYMSDKNKN